MDYIQKYESPLGTITIASTQTHLVGLWFDGQKYDRSILSKECEEKNLPILNETKRWLDLYFSGQKPDFLPLIQFRGTPFQKQVWEILMHIPYGTTRTYGQIAKQMGLKSAQAVGQAVGHNPISILVPCHRVVGANGSLTGYAGGMERKIKLLEIEQN